MMREFLRGCLVWLLGFPLSVVAATIVLTAPVWGTAPYPLESAVRMVPGAVPVVGLFAFAGAVMTQRSANVWPYVAAGARTGVWCGALAFSMFVVVGVSAALGEWLAVLQGHAAHDAGPMLLNLAAWVVGGLAVFAVAGATGGFVFGLVAAGPAPEAQH